MQDPTATRPSGAHDLARDRRAHLELRWTYPVVCDVATGELNFDNYSGGWGEQKELDKFLQAYAVEKARLESHKRGHTLTERE